MIRAQTWIWKHYCSWGLDLIILKIKSQLPKGKRLIKKHWKQNSGNSIYPLYSLQKLEISLASCFEQFISSWYKIYQAHFKRHLTVLHLGMRGLFFFFPCLFAILYLLLVNQSSPLLSANKLNYIYTRVQLPSPNQVGNAVKSISVRKWPRS